MPRPAASAQPTVVIGIPTFKRPVGLKRLLDSLAKLEGVQPHILVVDNEGENGQGLKAVNEVLKAGYPWPITAVPEPARGISQARNTLLSEGFGTLKADFLAMIDDDEWVEPHWLRALLEMQAQTDADVVESHVKPDFPDNPPSWAYATSLYTRPVKKAGDIPLVYGTTSVLVAATLVPKMAVPKFNPAFSLTGGGDEEFFRRAKAAGATFACAPASVAWEVFESSRVNVKWALRRAFRVAQGNLRVRRLHGLSLLGAVREALVVLAGLAVGAALTITLCWHPRYRLRGPLMLARQVGKIAVLIQEPYREYKHVHGT
jgi:succinoglycan biosynthesis protein ExoM